MNKKYNKIFTTEDSLLTLYVGNLRELYRGLLLIEDVVQDNCYRVDFGNAPDYIYVSQTADKKLLEQGLYTISDSCIVNDIRKRAYGLADHLELKHYVFICGTIRVDIVTHELVHILLEHGGKEVQRWNIG